MRTKNKGKVHPSPSPLPPFSSSKGDECLSVLKLLPAVTLVLVSALSPEDKQVLAYLVTRSLKTTTMNKKPKTHKAPVFDCECFDCYMSYWFRWDSSPNRELIHQIIEAFEDHLTNGENSSAASYKSNSRGGGKKKKDKSSRRRVEESPVASKTTEPEVVPCDEVKSPEKSTEMLRLPAATGHKGLARKMLPDVMGLFNSRFWRLWNPNA